IQDLPLSNETETVASEPPDTKETTVRSEARQEGGRSETRRIEAREDTRKRGVTRRSVVNFLAGLVVGAVFGSVLGVLGSWIRTPARAPAVVPAAAVASPDVNLRNAALAYLNAVLENQAQVLYARVVDDRTVPYFKSFIESKKLPGVRADDLAKVLRAAFNAVMEARMKAAGVNGIKVYPGEIKVLAGEMMDILNKNGPFELIAHYSPREGIGMTSQQKPQGVDRQEENAMRTFMANRLNQLADDMKKGEIPKDITPMFRAEFWMSEMHLAESKRGDLAAKLFRDGYNAILSKNPEIIKQPDELLNQIAKNLKAGAKAGRSEARELPIAQNMRDTIQAPWISSAKSPSEVRSDPMSLPSKETPQVSVRETVASSISVPREEGPLASNQIDWEKVPDNISAAELANIVDRFTKDLGATSRVDAGTVHTVLRDSGAVAEQAVPGPVAAPAVVAAVQPTEVREGYSSQEIVEALQQKGFSGDLKTLDTTHFPDVLKMRGSRNSSEEDVEIRVARIVAGILELSKSDPNMAALQLHMLAVAIGAQATGKMELAKAFTKMFSQHVMSAGDQPGLMIHVVTEHPSTEMIEAMRAIHALNPNQKFGLVLLGVNRYKAILDRTGMESFLKVEFSSEATAGNVIQKIQSQFRQTKYVVTAKGSLCDKLQDRILGVLVERDGVDAAILDTAGTAAAASFSRDLAAGKELSEKTSGAIKKSDRRYRFDAKGLKAIFAQVLSEIQGILNISKAA
ncbi:MAG: hypothetical protein PHV97_06085, partial [Candidatus Omnitrophica bacterium]|nr:hypothetical protein [Candidatus Omnitrophota bacterium]